MRLYLAFQGVRRGFRHSALVRRVRRLGAGFVLAQNPNDLLFRKHGSPQRSASYSPESNSTSWTSTGEGQPPARSRRGLRFRENGRHRGISLMFSASD